MLILLPLLLGIVLCTFFSKELRMLDDVIDRAFDWKHEVTVSLNLMRQAVDDRDQVRAFFVIFF